MNWHCFILISAAIYTVCLLLRTPKTPLEVSNSIVSRVSYDVVLIATEDLWSDSKKQVLSVFRSVMDAYSKEGKFLCMFFTGNPNIAKMFSESSCVVITSFQRNKYGLPIINSLFSQAAQYNAKYYGYVNADILLDPELFQVLRYMQMRMQDGAIPKRHQLAGRVYYLNTTKMPSVFSSASDIRYFVHSFPKRYHALRGKTSADYFFLSKAAFELLLEQDGEFVVGRRRIDNYLMGLCTNTMSNCSLLDSTYVSNSIHIEFSSHAKRERNCTAEDREWNDGQFRKFRAAIGHLCRPSVGVVLRSNAGYELTQREEGCPVISMRAFLSDLAVNRTVLMMVVDSGYINLWKNSYFSGHLSNYPNLVVFCLDMQSYHALHRRFPAYYVPVDIDPSNMTTFASQASPLFKMKMRTKIALLLQVLRYGFNVLYIDSDIILLKDPFPYLQSISGYDLIAQKDEDICPGFMYLLSSNRSIAMMARTKELVEASSVHDQWAINSAVKRMRFPHLLLPGTLFPSGKQFFQKYQFYWDRTDSDFFIFHNSYVRGKFGKELRFKEMKLYSNDVDGEYSAARRYLTVERIDTSNVEKALLRLSVIANRLNRSLVLPPLPCTVKKWKYCNLCFFDKGDCFRESIERFTNPVKESVFFTNPKVPKFIVKENRENPIYRFQADCHNNTAYKSDFPANKENHNAVKCIPCRGRKDKCIMKEGRHSQSFVFKVFSIDCSCFLLTVSPVGAFMTLI